MRGSGECSRKGREVLRGFGKGSGVGKFCKSYRMRCREGLREGFDFRIQLRRRFFGIPRKIFGKFHDVW